MHPPLSAYHVDKGGFLLHRRIPIFYSALLLTGVNLLLRFVSTSFQVHISARIGAEGVGLLQLVMSVGALSITAGIAGIRTAAMYLTAEQLGRRRPDTVIWVLSGCFLYSIVCSCCIAAMLYRFAPKIAELWIGNPDTVHAIRLLALFLPITCLCGCMTGYFTAANRIGTLAAVEIAEQLCYMAVTMTMLTFWAKSDSVKACEAVVLGSGISGMLTLLFLVILRIKENNKVSPPIPVASRLFQAAVPLALADDLKAGISTTENLMVPKRLSLYPGELTPLATFGIVCGMVFPVIMFPAAILFALAELLIPELARCAAADNTCRIRYLVKRSLRVAALYGCFCSGILYLLADQLGIWLYQNDMAGHYLRIYSLLVPMLYCDSITDAMTKGLGQQKVCVRYNIITSAMDVILLFILLPKYGMSGYYFSFLVTHLINFLLSLSRLLKITGVGIPLSLPIFVLAPFGAAVMTASLFPSPTSRTVVFSLVISGFWLLFRVIRTEDFLWLRRMVIKR